MNTVKIRLFGAFRNLQDDHEVTLSLPEEVLTAGDLKAALANYWSERSIGGFDAAALLRKSAIATDEDILLETCPLPKGITFAILPPVSGG